VPRYLRREVPGRLTHDGRERQPLELDGLPGIVDGFRAEGVEAIAICLLHAYANPSHEEAVLAEVRELWPEISVVASHQITREWREYERTSTSVLSAYVQPVAERYLTRLSSGIRDGGFDGQLYIMQSNCGVDSVERTREIPITMVESGPASGFWGAAELGRLIGEPNVLALDIGGTTAKCSLIEGGHVKIMTDYWIGRNRTTAGYPIMVPVVDLVEIGNGGGSIAWVDDFGKLRVGPQSAGAMPGPAAFGRGGGMHAVALATELGMQKVVIPRAADVFSAWGMLMTDLRRDYFVTRLIGLREDSAGRFDALLAEVTETALGQFEAEGVTRDQVRFVRFAKMRYENQEHSVEILLPDGAIEPSSVEGIASSFHASYEREYTYRLDAAIEVVGVHLVAIAEIGKLEPARLPVTGRPLEDAKKAERDVDYATEGHHRADVYDGDALEPGTRFDGPAIVETKGSTTVIHPGNSVAVDEYGNLLIEIRAGTG
jgi:N-methylhydantoinase A/oxoprolinase/acetone carboxylase beta subunit